MLPNSNSERACRQLFLGGLFNDEEIRFSSKQKIRDNGVTGLVLGLLCYFEYEDNRLHNVADFLVRVQNRDGSWFFDDKVGAEKYSFENTMVILKALFEYQKRYPNYANKVAKAQKSGQEFLLRHFLFKDPVSGEVINRNWLRFSFPFYWFYDILVALDYFQQTNTKDPRLQPAIQIMQNKKTKNNTWKLENKHNGKTYIEMEQIGQPSKWNTLRSMRVTEWWKNNL